MTWHQDRLGNLTSKIGSGATPRGGDAVYKKSGIALIRSQNVYDFKFEPDGLAFIDETQADALANVELQPKDILLNITGDSIGRCCMVPDSILPARVNQHVAVIRKNQKLDPTFLLYCLNNPITKDSLLQGMHGATRKALTKGLIEDFKIRFPDLPLQHRIASILGALDDKIECNRRINQTLEQMAQALYKHWFVDFAPFHGEGMVETALGEIPRGWVAGRFGDIVSIDSRVINPQKFLDEEFLHLSIPAFDNERRPSAERGKKILSGKFLIDTNCVLVSKLNPRIYRVWTIFPKVQLRSITSTEFIPYVPKQGIAWAFLNCHLRDKRFIQDFESHATGTTGSRQRVRPERTLSFPCVVPPKDVLKQFEQIAGTYWIQIDRNSSENENLTVTRDYLLPKLMSGEIEIKSVEKEIQDVV